ncbi:MAG: hypothetical protein KKI08_27985 [Armatimonadetes bacterium]|nr:hypothetical protein [Armatimonadota bacterium]
MALLFPGLVGAALAAPPDGTLAQSNALRVIARNDYAVSPSLAPPLIMERGFWNMLPYWSPEGKQNQMMAAHVLPEPMVRDAARCYFLGDLKADGDDPLAVSADRLLKLTIDPRVPFVVYTSAGRPPFRCLDDFRVDSRAYREWKQAHPNFLGFWTGVEWDNEYVGPLGNAAGRLEWLRKHKCSETSVSRAQPLLERAAASRAGAVQGLHECHTALRRYYFDDPEKMIFLRGGWCFDHYALEFGGAMSVSETTNTGPYRHQVSLSSARGASRQYGRPWQWYIATYYNACDKDGKTTVNNEPNYTSPVRLMSAGAGENAGPGFGMSVSLSRRDKYLAYLSGASLVQHEDWPRAYCQPAEGKPDEWVLSPHGAAMKEWYDFTQRHPDRGVSYAPVALLMPFDQGLPQWGGAPWSHFNIERPDMMLDAFLNTLAPPSQDVSKGQEGALANTEFGDLYDLLTPNPPSGPVPLATLRNYKVAIVVGGLEVDEALAARLMAYVRQGGSLVINARQIGKHLPAAFLGAKPTGKTAPVQGRVITASGDGATLTEPHDYEPVELAGAEPLWRDEQGGVLACVNRFGAGRVVLTTVDYLLPRERAAAAKATPQPLVPLLLRQIVREVLPLDVQGDVEYGLCRVPDGWWVYLINNKGVTKYAMTPEELGPAATVTVTLNLRALAVSSATELRADTPLTVDQAQNAVTLDVGPGDIRIVHLVTGPASQK